MSSVAEKEAVTDLLWEIKGPVIVELGAHVGEEARWLSGLKPSRYVMVEPDIENCRKIILPPRGVLFCMAIAATTGSTTFYSADNTKSFNRASGSTHKPTGHLEHFPEVKFGDGIQVRCITLDKLVEEEKLPRVDLLWCDIQGAERDMIAGGRETLKRTRYMMLEAEPEVELYEGQALKPELIAMLPEWYVVKDFGYNLLMANREFNAKPIR
jgi:FkbM family methyltransferase